jgi:hypothetical protein
MKTSSSVIVKKTILPGPIFGTGEVDCTGEGLRIGSMSDPDGRADCPPRARVLGVRSGVWRRLDGPAIAEEEEEEEEVCRKRV